MSSLCLVLHAVFGQRVIRVPFHLLGYAIELVDVGPDVLLIQVRRTQFLFHLCLTLCVSRLIAL